MRREEASNGLINSGDRSAHDGYAVHQRRDALAHRLQRVQRTALIERVPVCILIVVGARRRFHRIHPGIATRKRARDEGHTIAHHVQRVDVAEVATGGRVGKGGERVGVFGRPQRAARRVTVPREPVRDVRHLRHVVTGPNARAMRFARQPHEFGGNAAQAEGGEPLFRLAKRRAVVGVSTHHEGGGLHACDARQRRLRPVMRGILPWRATQPVSLEIDAHVGGQHFAGPVHDGIQHRRRPESRRARGEPCREQSTAAAAGHVQLRRVGDAARHQRIDRGQQIVGIITGIRLVDETRKRFAVTGGAARIHVQHDVALRRHPLLLEIKPIAVGGERTAVDLENQRILLTGRVARRGDHPRLNRQAIF